MKISFLSASSPLTKTITKLANGSYKTSSYPNIRNYTSETTDIKNIEEFHEAILHYAVKDFCLLKGHLHRPLNNEPRAGGTNTHDSTQWVCLDIDGLPDVGSRWLKNEYLREKEITPDIVMQALGLGDISYILQWSASMGISKGKGLRCHIFFMLDRPMPAPVLKQWLIYMNLNEDMLRQSIALSKSQMYLSWPLDITACQNDKLIYIAPPHCIGFTDPLKTRIELVKKGKPYLTYPESLEGLENVHKDIATVTNMLRATIGLTPRKMDTTVKSGIEVAKNAAPQTITGIKQERGFTYFNLNGGDSWGYFHPDESPAIIYNFKGEPNYVTSEIIPSYWNEVTKKACVTQTKQDKKTSYLAITDSETAAYLKIMHTSSEEGEELTINVARSETQLRHFAMQHGIPMGDFIQEWKVKFDPSDTNCINHEQRYINLFKPTQYMQAEHKTQTKVPATIEYVISHALNHETEVVAHFYNWLAYIAQNKEQTKTAWLLQGTQGTGKGIIINNIIRPLFGHNQTLSCLLNDLEDRYNPWMRNTFICFVDEFNSKNIARENQLTAKLKSFITEPTVMMRDLYQTPTPIKNRTNWILASNQSGSVRAEANDRRFNIGGFQTKSIKITPEDITAIEEELQDFWHFLMSWEVDKQAARVPIKTQEKENLIATTQTGAESVAQAIHNGDIQFFIDQLPTNDYWQGDPLRNPLVCTYRQTLTTIMQRTNKGKSRITRDELQILFEYTVGNVPESPNKFTSYLRHVRLFTKQTRIDNRNVMGIEVTWTAPDTIPTLLKEHFDVELVTQQTIEQNCSLTV